MRRIVAFSITLFPLYGQGPAITGSGYSYPGATVAPGQIVTLFVTGLTIPGGPFKASGFPLPTQLAGVSVTIDQTGLALGHISYTAPLQEVWTAAPLYGWAAVTVQIPFEVLYTDHCPSGGSSLSCPATITVSQNSAASQSFPITIHPDSIHILNSCDRFPSANLPVIGCSAVVTHADGSLVSATAPAAAGEEVVLYAFGLGQTNPRVKTGDATPSPAPVSVSLLNIQFDSRVNAAPSFPYPPIESPFVPVALFNGLIPGLAGLYQINVKIPVSLPPLPVCADATPQSADNGVLTNLTVDIGGSTSFDGAAICVAPSQQP